MAESKAHMDFVRRIASVIPHLYTQCIEALISTDLPEFIGRPRPSCGGYIPDVYYRDIQAAIIGEAKTSWDIDNEHTQNQLDSYVDEVRTMNGYRAIIYCSDVMSFAHIKNMLIQYKRKHNITDIDFYALDNVTKVSKL